MKVRSLIWILLVLLLLLTAGCNQMEKPPVTTVTTAPNVTTTTPTTTEAPNEGLVLYQAAVQELSQRRDLSLYITIEESLILPAESINQKTTLDITYLGLGTDAFRAKTKETINIGIYNTPFSTIYADGKAYLNSLDGSFVAEQDAVGYLDSQLPIILIDETKYGDCTYTQSSGKTTVTFGEGQVFEDWAGHASANLVRAEGTAVISAEGVLERYTYDLEYTLMGANMKQTITADISAPKSDSIEAPASLDGYNTVSDLDPVKMLCKAYFRSSHSKSVSYHFAEEIFSEATNAQLTLNLELQRFGTGQDTMVRISQNVNPGTTEAWECEEIYRDRVYTYSENKGPAERNPNVSLSDMENVAVGLVSEMMFAPRFLADFTINDLGDVLLFQCNGTEAAGDIIQDAVCSEYYGDAEYLNRYASAYRTEKLEVYIAIDKYFGFCTAMGYSFEGIHTIDGKEYVLAADINTGLSVASQEAYNAITDEAMPMETKESPTPLFYHVTGKDGQELWLLGTIHVGDARTGNLPKEILEAFQNSDALAVECDPRKAEEEMQNPLVSSAYAMALYYMNGSKVKDHIEDKELYDAAVNLMKASGNYNSYAESIKVSIWSNTISGFIQRLGYGPSSDMGVDYRLLRLADASGKKILQVESNLSQMAMFGGWSDPLAEMLLSESVATDAVSYYAGIIELYELWCAGNEEALKAAVNEDPGQMTEEEKVLFDEYNNGMHTKRNQKMVETAIAYLEGDETVFYAVGLAHVIAEDGLVNALRDAGYTVSLVTYAE